MLQNVDKTGQNNITFKPLTSRNKRGTAQVVLKRDSKGILQFNNVEKAQKAVRQFKELIDEIQEEQEDRDETTERMPIVNTNVEFKSIKYCH